MMRPTEQLSREELLGMIKNQMTFLLQHRDHVDYLHTEVREMAQAISNEAPDLMLRKLTLVIEKVGEWDRERGGRDAIRP
jgi:hypothetical protein